MSKPRIIRVPLKDLFHDPISHCRPNFTGNTSLIAIPMHRPYSNEQSFHPITRLAQNLFNRSFDPFLFNWHESIQNERYRLVLNAGANSFYLLTMPWGASILPHPAFAHKKHLHPTMAKLDPSELPTWDTNVFAGFRNIGSSRECFIPWLPWDRGNDIKPSDMPDLFPRLYHRATFFHP